MNRIDRIDLTFLDQPVRQILFILSILSKSRFR